MESEYKREQSITLLVIFVLAALSLVSLLIAFSYYCYISNKVSKHLKSLSRAGEKDEPEKAAPLDGGSGSSGEAPVVETGVHVFTFKQLLGATGGFGKGMERMSSRRRCSFFIVHTILPAQVFLLLSYRFTV